MAKNNIKKLTGASLGAALAVGATLAGVSLISHPQMHLHTPLHLPRTETHTSTYQGHTHKPF